jgi:chitodextrinase
VAAFRAAGTTHTDTVGGGGSCPTPPVSPSVSPSASPTVNPTGGPGCATAPFWNINAVYLGGNTVRHQRSANGVPGGPPSGDGVHLWRARWWTQGSEPGWTQQWEDLGRC